MTSSNSKVEPAQDRDVRQVQVRDWVIRCFGERAMTEVGQDEWPTAHERAERLLEEVLELCQAESYPVERVALLTRKVWEREPGTLVQEVGGVSTTLLGYCEFRGLSADWCERRELERILNLPPEHFAKRQAEKVKSGMAVDLREHSDE